MAKNNKFTFKVGKNIGGEKREIGTDSKVSINYKEDIMSKTPFIIFALTLCTLFGQGLYAERINNVRELDTNQNGIYEENEVNACGEYQCGPCICYCPVTRFKPKYYCVDRCEQEPYTVKKKCCRYVDQYYTKKHCRYVPQYYTKTYCRQVPEYYSQSYCRKVPEYYYTCETKYRNKIVKEKKCRYEPYTCWEKRCIDAPNGCPTCPGDGKGYAQPADASSNHKNGRH